MARIVSKTVNAKTGLNVIQKKEHASAWRDGQGYTATRRAHLENMERTVSTNVPAKAVTQRNLATSRAGNVHANLVIKEIGMLLISCLIPSVNKATQV